MRGESLQLAAELAARGEAFVVAVVVRREGLSSAQLGDMAVITADGGYHGWVGGSCTRTSVQREAARCLADGRPRLVCLSPEPDPQPRAGILPVTMTCHSGGTVEIFLEPVLVAPRLLVFGGSPVARALVELGRAMGYRVVTVDPEAAAERGWQAGLDGTPDSQRGPAPPTYAVVATMGEQDEEAVAAALALRPTYLGVVASRKRFASMCEVLVARGTSAEALAGIRSPAGLDLGGRLPAEVALSILAEIVQRSRAAETRPETTATTATTTAAAPPTTAVDPVCKMTVDIAGARHTAAWDGRTWYFCNPGCRERFLAEPRRYLGHTPLGVVR